VPSSPEFREARQALGRTLGANPRFADAHAALGKLLLGSGDLPAAVRALRAAITLDPSNRLALNQLVIAYRRLGREADALAAAADLKALLARQRVEEVARNRIRLVKGDRAPGDSPR
jgi:Flp pilus assembly protein TadD